MWADSVNIGSPVGMGDKVDFLEVRPMGTGQCPASRTTICRTHEDTTGHPYFEECSTVWDHRTQTEATKGPNSN